MQSHTTGGHKTSDDKTSDDKTSDGKTNDDEQQTQAALFAGPERPSSRYTLLTMLRIRPATIADVPSLRTMIREFADFEHELHNVTISEEALAQDGFGPAPRFRTLFAEWNGEAAGYALFFGCYSTWVGPGLFLEDIYVRESFAGTASEKRCSPRSPALPSKNIVSA